MIHMNMKTVKFYCLKGRHNISTSNYKLVKLKKGRKAFRARCPKHGNVIYRIAGKEVDMNL